MSKARIIPRPFGHPKHKANAGLCKGNEMPCAWCGKPIDTDHASYWVRIVDGGGRFATRDDPPDTGAGEMGAHPLGGRCASFLFRAGVTVHYPDGSARTLENPRW